MKVGRDIIQIPWNYQKNNKERLNKSMPTNSKA